MLNKKDLLALNQQFSHGRIVNPSSLDFVLSQTHHSRDWFKAMCLLARAILVDHVFEDGNKRTAAAVIMLYLNVNGQSFNADNIAKIVLQISKKNIKNINTIGRLINHGAA
ncbi:Fic family protein [Candidatus Woesearchaeota archaeon]|nr:Fic family protein [Candidatus Woesearchaeota archaeon]